jgi:hypothetical protein
VQFDGEVVRPEVLAAGERLLAVYNEATGHSHGTRTASGKASSALRPILGVLLDDPSVPLRVWEPGVRSMAKDPPEWHKGKPWTIGDMFGPNARMHTLERGRRALRKPKSLSESITAIRNLDTG